MRALSLLAAAAGARGLLLGAPPCAHVPRSVVTSCAPAADDAASAPAADDAASAPAADAAAKLAVEDVRRMFADVREHYRNTGEVEEGQVCRNLMVTRVNEFTQNDALDNGLAVRPSPLHGDGLFAAYDVDEGALLTFFPGDALLFWESGDRAGDMLSLLMLISF